MIIWVHNTSDVTKAQMQQALRAVNVQIERDFKPIWGLSAEVLMHHKGARMRVPVDGRVGHIHIHTHGPAIGFHDDERSGIPAGFVITDLAKATRTALPWLTWTVALSHEVLELIADPFLNLFAKGPHPTNSRHQVFHYREVCDPIQGTTYDIGGIELSNFVLPHYYNAASSRKGTDFLKLGLEPFRWIDSGYIGFWDPKLGSTGRYVYFPKYKPSHPASKVLRAKGRTSRLRRYALTRGSK